MNRRRVPHRQKSHFGGEQLVGHRPDFVRRQQRTGKLNVDDSGGDTNTFIPMGGKSEPAFEADGKLKPRSRPTTVDQETAAPIG